MLDRRTLLAAAIPLAGSAHRNSTPVSNTGEITPIETFGSTILSISPDGSMLLGRRDDVLAFIDVAAAEVIAETEPHQAIPTMDEFSIGWSPEASRIAFGILPSVLDSDILIVDIATGEITNVTPEGSANEFGEIMDEPNALRDTAPTWLDSDTVAFLRAHPTSEDFRPELVSLNLATSETETLADLAGGDMAFAAGPMIQTSDGTLVFHARMADGTDRIATSTADAELRLLEVEGVSHLYLISANTHQALVMDVLAFTYFVVSLHDDHTPIPLPEFISLPDGTSIASEPTLGEEKNSLFAVVGRDDSSVLYSFQDGEANELGELDIKTGGVVCQHAEGVVLVRGDEQSWLVPYQ